MSLGETIIYCGLGGFFVFLFFFFNVGTSLCSLGGFNIFSERSVFSMDDCHLFLQCMLLISLFIGGVTGVVVTTACTGC